MCFRRISWSPHFQLHPQAFATSGENYFYLADDTFFLLESDEFKISFLVRNINDSNYYFGCVFQENN